jgi:hypothetical protein
MTWKLAHPNPTFVSAGHIIRCQQLSLERGVIRSEGNTQASSLVTTDIMRQFSMSVTSPSESPASPYE